MSLSFYIISGFTPNFSIFFRFHPIQINWNSAFTFFRPRKRKDLYPRLNFKCPNIGSIVYCRLKYFSLPSLLVSFLRSSLCRGSLRSINNSRILDFVHNDRIEQAVQSISSYTLWFHCRFFVLFFLVFQYFNRFPSGQV